MAYTLPHPQPVGGFIRRNILERNNLSVTQAAQILGVGRPALSNMLNGNSRLSESMAAAISAVFGISVKTLLNIQHLTDLKEAQEITKDLIKSKKVKKFVPHQGLEIAAM
ncbi:MAG: HigA family addiction module antitoxin [Zymomonas mobilis]|uniref:HigA family addiction module antitoxin n=1 Tax=Zymomonas mobilis TaxID=542 RepID=UPI0039E97E7C